MTEMTIYMAPNACSRVTMVALEEIGVDYDAHAINLFVGEQKSAAYLAVNPKGKVPALRIAERTLTENPAILHYLHHAYPAVGLLPDESGGGGVNEALEDLVWCGGTLHPLVRQIRMPVRYSADHVEGIRANGIENFAKAMDLIAARVGDGYWYGDRWSMIDVYLVWLYQLAATVEGFDLARWPGIADHAARILARPACVRALGREAAAKEAAGIVLPA